MPLEYYQQQIEHLNEAAKICSHHTIKKQVNGVKAPYPRWPEAWKACETVWRNYLEVQTMSGATDEKDRQKVITESKTLR